MNASWLVLAPGHGGGHWWREAAHSFPLTAWLAAGQPSRKRSQMGQAWAGISDAQSLGGSDIKLFMPLSHVSKLLSGLNQRASHQGCVQ